MHSQILLKVYVEDNLGTIAICFFKNIHPFFKYGLINYETTAKFIHCLK